jgi:hypothetical protein
MLGLMKRKLERDNGFSAFGHERVIIIGVSLGSY